MSLVAIHEAGHCIVANELGFNVKEVHIYENSGQTHVSFADKHNGSIVENLQSVIEVLLAGWAAEIAFYQTMTGTKKSFPQLELLMSERSKKDLENIYSISKHNPFETFNISNFTKKMVPAMHEVKNRYFGSSVQINYLFGVAKDLGRKSRDSFVTSSSDVKTILKHPTPSSVPWGNRSSDVDRLGDMLGAGVALIVLAGSVSLILWIILYFFHIV